MPSNVNSLRDQNPPLIVKELQDIYVRKNFEQLRAYFNNQNQLFDFKYFELEFSAAQTNYRQGHGLQTNPQDVIVTNIVGDVVVTFNKGKFDTSEFDMTVSGPCKVSFFLGTYWNRPSPPTPHPKDAQTFNNGSSSSSGALAGEVKIWPGPIVPDGYLLCDGTIYDASTYPALAKVLWDPSTNRYAWGGSGQYPKGNFNVPDMRGVVPRGLSGDSNNDPDKTTRTSMNGTGNEGNLVGTYQPDIVGDHWHSQWTRNNWTFATGSTSSGPFSGGNLGQGQTSGSNMIGTNKDTRIGNETRMKNVAVNYIIKT